MKFNGGFSNCGILQCHSPFMSISVCAQVCACVWGCEWETDSCYKINPYYLYEKYIYIPCLSVKSYKIDG